MTSMRSNATVPTPIHSGSHCEVPGRNAADSGTETQLSRTANTTCAMTSTVPRRLQSDVR